MPNQHFDFLERTNETDICENCSTKVAEEDMAISVDGRARVCKPCLSIEQKKEVKYLEELYHAFDRSCER